MVFRPTDIPFNADDAHRFLPWLMGVMVGLAAFLLCVGLSLNYWVADKQTVISSNFTVNIPAGQNTPENVAKIEEELKKHPGIAKVHKVSEKELKGMLEPWLGDASSSELPLPAVLSVTLTAPEADFDYAALEKSLSSHASGVEVDAHDRWVDAFARFSSAVRGISGLLAFLVIGAMGMTVLLAARASLKLHAVSVQLLHSIGAEDKYITRQFQHETLRLVLPGAFAGCAAAGLLFWAAGAYLASLDISMLPPLPLTGNHLLLLIMMPLVIALAASTVTRASISSELERVL